MKHIKGWSVSRKGSLYLLVVETHEKWVDFSVNGEYLITVKGEAPSLPRFLPDPRNYFYFSFQDKEQITVLYVPYELLPDGDDEIICEG